jgi:hypothetical protein
MKRSLFTLLRGVMAACALSMMAGTALGQHAPPGVNPTHYWTYKAIDPIPAMQQLIAADQFYPAAVPLRLTSLDRLVNWVSKNGSPVLPDTLLHYTWWNILEKLPTPRVVRVINQFGDHNVNVVNLEFMLVPAWKNQPQPGQPQANHYLCYRALGFPPPPAPFAVQLADEWRQDIQPPMEMEYLCNPCMKSHSGQTYPIVDPNVHFALFRIAPLSDLFIPFVQDQFITATLPVQQTPIEYLLVPSQKIDDPTPTRRSTWGEVKTIYR